MRGQRKPAKGSKCDACKEVVQGMRHHLRAVAEPPLTAASKARVRASVENYCNALGLRRVAFKETAPLCEVMVGDHLGDVASAVVSNLHAADGEALTITRVCQKVLKVRLSSLPGHVVRRPPTERVCALGSQVCKGKSSTSRLHLDL